jgi:hypothetical protein
MSENHCLPVWCLKTIVKSHVCFVVWCVKTIVLPSDVWTPLSFHLMSQIHCLVVCCQDHFLIVCCTKTAGYILLQYYFTSIFVYVRLRSHRANEERDCLDAGCWAEYCVPRGSNKLGLYKLLSEDLHNLSSTWRNSWVGHAASNEEWEM